MAPASPHKHSPSPLCCSPDRNCAYPEIAITQPPDKAGVSGRAGSTKHFVGHRRALIRPPPAGKSQFGKAINYCAESVGGIAPVRERRPVLRRPRSRVVAVGRDAGRMPRDAAEAREIAAVNPTGRVRQPTGTTRPGPAQSAGRARSRVGAARAAAECGDRHGQLPLRVQGAAEVGIELRRRADRSGSPREIR